MAFVVKKKRHFLLKTQAKQKGRGAVIGKTGKTLALKFVLFILNNSSKELIFVIIARQENQFFLYLIVTC